MQVSKNPGQLSSPAMPSGEGVTVRVRVCVNGLGGNKSVWSKHPCGQANTWERHGLWCMLTCVQGVFVTRPAVVASGCQGCVLRARVRIMQCVLRMCGM